MPYRVILLRFSDDGHKCWYFSFHYDYIIYIVWDRPLRPLVQHDHTHTALIYARLKSVELRLNHAVVRRWTCSASRQWAVVRCVSQEHSQRVHVSHSIVFTSHPLDLRTILTGARLNWFWNSVRRGGDMKRQGRQRRNLPMHQVHPKHGFSTKPLARHICESCWSPRNCLQLVSNTYTIFSRRDTTRYCYSSRIRIFWTR